MYPVWPVPRHPLTTHSHKINEMIFSHGEYFPTAVNTFEVFHNVCISRTPRDIKWWMDGEVKRTLLASSVPGKFPFRSSKLVFTIWDGGSGAPGTSDWAGGPTDWSNPAPADYRIQVGQVQIRCEDENGRWVNTPVGQGETCSTTTVSFFLA